MADIYKELNKLNRNTYYDRRRKYFLWKNKMDTTKTVYSDKTEEELKENLNVNDVEWAFIKRWEESEQYHRLMYVKYENKFDADLLEVYDAIKKSAMEGNSSAVKTMLELQQEIKGKLQEHDKEEEEEETTLKLDI